MTLMKTPKNLAGTRRSASRSATIGTAEHSRPPACGLLLAAASLGITLVFLPRATTTTAAPPGDDPPSVGHPPVSIIAAHITAACITILLATLAAIGSG